jgi:hypothetical protein
LSSASFALWNPGVYAYYRERVQKIRKKMPHLTPNSSKTIFPSAAFNLRKVCTFKHRDSQNCPFGWCAITALGSFDPKKGGHLVLSDLKLIIEFPPGSTILMPSATIEHYNIPVMEGEERASFTQYCAGNIFRYVDNGFRTDAALKVEDPALYEEMDKQKDTRWKMGLGLFSTMDDLRKRVQIT